MRLPLLPLSSTLSALLLLSGCGATENVARLSDAVYPALPDGATVEVTTGDLDAPYEELAIVVVGRGNAGWFPSEAEEVAQMNESLRREARALGAQAVVRVVYDITAEHPRATGTAVRLRAN